MKKSILFTVIALGAFMTSCKSPMTLTTRTARTEVMPIETWASLVTADLEVSDQKANFTYEAPADDRIAMTEEQMKENAIGALLEQYSADVLINPLFKKDYIDGKLVSITVSGYPARHKNFHTISFEEQTEYLLEKEKAANAPQIVINGGEIKNEVVAPAPAPAPAPVAAPAPAPAPEKPKAKPASKSKK